MRSRLLRLHLASAAVILGAAGLAHPASAQGSPGSSLRDFRLPVDRDAVPAEPAPQGPVDPEAPLPPSPSGEEGNRPPEQPPAQAPEIAPTATPATPPRVIVPVTPLPSVVPPSPAARRDAARQPALPASPGPAPDTAPAGTAPAIDLPAAEDPANRSDVPSVASPSVARQLEAPHEQAAEDRPWIAVLGALAALAALTFGILFLRRRRRDGAQALPAVAPPQITKPTPRSPAPPAPEPGPGPGPVPVAVSPRINATEPSPQPLEVTLEPLRLSLTLLNATLSYRFIVNNHGAAPLEGVAIVADMISAHATLSREQQLSGPDATAMQLACIDRLEAGESRVISGEFRLPFTQIKPVRQGNAVLLFPLARVRAEAKGGEPVTRTFLVAQPAERAGGGLQPFRLDLGPRVYPDLAQRAFA